MKPASLRRYDKARIEATEKFKAQKAAGEIPADVWMPPLPTPQDERAYVKGIGYAWHKGAGRWENKWFQDGGGRS
jgi:hypothetical protein